MVCTWSRCTITLKGFVMDVCKSCNAKYQTDNFCSICGERLQSPKELTTSKLPTFKDFQKFRHEKETERRQTFTTKRRKPHQIKINVGVMRNIEDKIKYVRGSMLPVEVFPQSTENEVLEAATKKHLSNNKSLPKDEYVLLYKDGSLVSTLPGTPRSFSVRGYKDFIGKTFQNLQLYICPKSEHSSVLISDSSDSNDLDDPPYNCLLDSSDTWEKLDSPEILRKKEKKTKIKSKSSEPSSSSVSVQQESKPSTCSIRTTSNSQQPRPSTSTESKLQISHQSEPYSHYITIISDGSEEEEEADPTFTNSPVDNQDMTTPHQDATSTNKKSTREILQELAENINLNQVSRININRKSVFDGACRGFRRSTFSPNNSLLVKFTDDTGLSEEAVDQGGPRREFLRLLMEAIQQSKLFEGPLNSRILTLDSQAMQKDDYYIAGVMIAVDLVHGGPPPMFLSKLLFKALVNGPEKVETTMEDIPDSEFKDTLISIAGADTVERLRLTMDIYSSTLTLAGCFHHVREVEDKNTIVKHLIQWYLFGRTRLAFERFKAGLETLDILNSIQTYPENFEECLVHVDMKLSALTVDDLFVPHLSVEGNNKRDDETRTIGYWRDYLQDAEEGKSATSLETILIFSTGTDRISPLGLTPCPKLSFLHKSNREDGGSRFPIANTCANELRLPIHDTFEWFKANMEFGILNSPNFGRL